MTFLPNHSAAIHAGLFYCYPNLMQPSEPNPTGLTIPRHQGEVDPDNHCRVRLG